MALKPAAKAAVTPAASNPVLMLQGVRIAFADGLFEAQAFQGEGKPTFGCSGIFPKNSPIKKQVQDGIRKAAQIAWGAKAEAVVKMLAAQDKLCIHDGDTKANYDGFEGNLFISCRAKKKPTTLDRNRVQVDAASGVIYAGCYGNLSVEIWAQDNKWGKRINATVRGFQFVRDGDAFSGGAPPAAEDEFEDLGEQGEEPTAEGDEEENDLMG